MTRAQAGLTLVELMVALVVAAIAFTALAFSQTTGFRVSREAQGTAVAKDVAQAQLELIRSYGYDFYRRCPQAGPPEGIGIPPCSASQEVPLHPDFTLSWQVSTDLGPTATVTLDGAQVSIAELDPPALVGVRVEVSWRSGRYDLIGYLSCGDPGETATTTVPCPGESMIGGS